MEREMTKEEAMRQIEAVAAILRRYSENPDMYGGDDAAMAMLSRELLEALDTLKASVPE